MRRIDLKSALGVAAITILVPILFVAHFAYIDAYSIPLWMAPADIRDAVREVVPADGNETVRFINFDTFDYEHINILTDRRLLRLDSFTSGLSYAINLHEIAKSSLDQSDSRYLIIQTNDGEIYTMFFVGSPVAFRDAIHEHQTQK